MRDEDHKEMDRLERLLKEACALLRELDDSGYIKATITFDESEIEEKVQDFLRRTWLDYAE